MTTVSSLRRFDLDSLEFIVEGRRRKGLVWLQATNDDNLHMVQNWISRRQYNNPKVNFFRPKVHYVKHDITATVWDPLKRVLERGNNLSS